MAGKNARNSVAQALSAVLADTYLTYLKTQNFHWNVKGPNFPQLHALFEGQYQELAAAVDEIAERIVALGARAPGSFAEFQKLAEVEEAGGTPGAAAMLAELIATNEQVLKGLRRFRDLADDVDDVGSEDLAIQRIRAHEKALWMLRATAARA
jgi:starvation-inducible DNA-binding protein